MSLAVQPRRLCPWASEAVQETGSAVQSVMPHMHCTDCGIAATGEGGAPQLGPGGHSCGKIAQLHSAGHWRGLCDSAAVPGEL